MTTTVSGSFHRPDYTYTPECIEAAQKAFDTFQASLAEAGFSSNMSLVGGVTYNPGSRNPGDSKGAPADPDGSEE